jgi:hypothetical protein
MQQHAFKQNLGASCGTHVTTDISIRLDYINRLYVRVCVHVCVCVCVFIYIHIYIKAFVRHACNNGFIHIYIYIYIWWRRAGWRQQQQQAVMPDLLHLYLYL